MCDRDSNSELQVCRRRRNHGAIVAHNGDLCFISDYFYRVSFCILWSLLWFSSCHSYCTWESGSINNVRSVTEGKKSSRIAFSSLLCLSIPTYLQVVTEQQQQMILCLWEAFTNLRISYRWAFCVLRSAFCPAEGLFFQVATLKSNCLLI